MFSDWTYCVLLLIGLRRVCNLDGSVAGVAGRTEAKIRINDKTRVRLSLSFISKAG